MQSCFMSTPEIFPGTLYLAFRIVIGSEVRPPVVQFAMDFSISLCNNVIARAGMKFGIASCSFTAVLAITREIYPQILIVPIFC